MTQSSLPLDQLSTYQLAWNELKHAMETTGDEEFLATLDRVENRLIAQYPNDEPAIIEMLVAWQVGLGYVPPKAQRGFL